MSLKCLTQFSAPTLKRQSSDNVASLWGKILLGSEIQEKNAENNLLENQSNIKGTKKEAVLESRINTGVNLRIYI